MFWSAARFFPWDHQEFEVFQDCPRCAFILEMPWIFFFFLAVKGGGEQFSEEYVGSA